MRVVTVTPLLSGIPYEELSYFSKMDLVEGDLVEIQIHKRTCKAIVIGSHPVEEERQSLRHASFNLKKISKVITPQFLPKSTWEALRFCASYLLLPIGQLLYELLSQKSQDLLSPIQTTKDSKGFELLLLEQGYEYRLARYKTTIRELFSKKKSLVIFFPTITDIEYAEKELSRGIEDYTVTLHSGLSEKTYREHHLKVQSDEHPLLILTTPSLIPWTRNDLGLVVIEREHSTYYYTHGDEGYDMRFVITTLTKHSNIPCVLGSHTLSLSAHLKYQQKNAHELIPLQYRNDFPISVVQMTEENKTGNPYLSKQALHALHEAKQTGHGHIFLYAHRKGMYPTTLCMDCGTLLTCTQCSRPYVLHKIAGKRVYVCHGCEKTLHTQDDVNLTCTHCGGWRMVTLGIATTGVEEELSHLAIPTFVIDGERTPTRAKAKKVLKDWMESPYGVLIGTEMAHNLVRYCDGVIVLSVDSLFSLPEYRTDEKLLNLVTEMAEKIVKINNEPVGNLIFQTRLKQTPIIKQLTSPSYREVFDNLLQEREEFSLPPYAVVIKSTFKNLDATRHELLEKEFADHKLEWYEHGNETTTLFIHVKEKTWLTEQSLREKAKRLLYDGSPQVNPPHFFI